MSLLELALACVMVLGTIVLAIVAIKLVVSFDINKWQERQDKIRKERLKALCPHADVEFLEDGRVQIISSIISPPGTLMWICSRCGITTHDADLVRRMVKEYTEKPDLLADKEKRFRKYAKKYLRT